MDLGLHVKYFGYPDGPVTIAPTLARTGQAAEAAGLAWLSVMDHFFQIDEGAADQPMLEGYTTLGFLAAHSSTIQLGLGDAVERESAVVGELGVQTAVVDDPPPA